MWGTGRKLSTAEKIRDLIAALCDPEIEKRHDAVSALREVGEPAVAPLIAAVAQAQDNDQRWYTAVALSQIGGPAIMPLIAAMAVHTSRDFRKSSKMASISRSNRLGLLQVESEEPGVIGMTSVVFLSGFSRSIGIPPMFHF